MPTSPPASEPRSAVDLLSDPHTPGWRGALLRMGRTRAVVLISGVSLGLSVALTAALVVAIGETHRLGMFLGVAATIPLLVAPLVSNAALGLLAEVEAARRALREVAIRDGLTELHNRRFFLLRLEDEVVRAQRQGTPLCVILIDVDHFKQVNDRHGHTTGDEVLVHVARTLVTHARPYDLTARLGGEEFVAVLPGALPADGLAAAEWLRAAIADLRVPALAGQARPHVTASLGVADLGGSADTAEALLKRADGAMYAAKAAGRNRCHAAAA